MNEEVQNIFNMVKQELEKAFESSLFDRENIKEEAIKTMKIVQETNYGLSENYKVICDETNNSQKDIENGVVNATIYYTNPIAIKNLLKEND